MYCSVRSKIEPYNHMSCSECFQYLEFQIDNMTQNISQKDKGRIGDFLWTFRKSIGNSSFNQKSIQKKIHPNKKIHLFEITSKNPSTVDCYLKISIDWQNITWRFSRLQKLTWKNSWSTLGRWAFLFVDFVCCVFFQETCLEAEHFWVEE